MENSVVSKRVRKIIKKGIKKTMKQGRASMIRQGECAYRGEDGLKCIVGHMIPDELYLSNMDEVETSAYDLLISSPYVAKYLEVDISKIDEWSNIWNSLQGCHDACTTVRDDEFRHEFMEEIKYRVNQGILPPFMSKAAIKYEAKYRNQQQ